MSVIFCNAVPYNSNALYRCGESKVKPIPLPLDRLSSNQKGKEKYKRSLDSEFHDFNIFLDLNNFDDDIKKYNLKNKRDLFVTGMEKAVKTLQSLLKVKSPGNFYFYDEDLRDYDIYNWDKTKIGTKLAEQDIGMEDLGIDLYIFINLGVKEEFGENIYANAQAIYMNPITGQPLLGIVNINIAEDYSKKNSLEFFQGMILHEFTHILGFEKYYFINYFHNYFTKIDKYGYERAYINSTKVLQVAKKYFNCDNIDGVELENDGGEGTFGSHWEGRILLGEYMNGYVDILDQAISEFTLALLEDSGYYKANYYTGGLMQYGKNKGCKFLNSECMVNGKIDPEFSNEFFDKITNKINGVDTSCSSGRQSRAYHCLIDYNYDIPKEYRYFNLKNRGGQFFADYCPISVYLNEEQKNIYNTGRCSKIGGDNYGSFIPYKYSGSNIKYYPSGTLTSITGETLSENSFCVLSSLISKKVSNYNIYSKTLRAVCFQMHCSDRSLTIQINNNFKVCPRAGGKINSPNFEGYLLCPDYNLICSGTVLCNDMFDCVEKKSILKDVEYDYIPRTSQNYDQILNDKIEEDDYELSKNGKCPENCSECNEKGKCLVCKGGMILDKENKCNNCPAGKYALKGGNICNDCPVGYYSNDGSSFCIKCDTGFYSSKGSSKCLKCPDGFYPSVDASSCKPKCNNGQYLSANKCYSCIAGTYSLAGAINCLNCPAGTYSNKGASSCTNCTAGKYSNISSSQCDYCPAGTY